MKMNRLIGKNVTKVFVAQDKKAIKFVTNDKDEVIARTDGDCCSNSYIQHIEFVQLFPATVTDVEDVPMDSLPETQYGDLIQCYGCKIKTDKGVFFLEYRNESNGYYGGDLVWDDEHFYGGVYDQNKSNEIWEEMNADF